MAQMKSSAQRRWGTAQRLTKSSTQRSFLVRSPSFMLWQSHHFSLLQFILCDASLRIWAESEEVLIQPSLGECDVVAVHCMLWMWCKVSVQCSGDQTFDFCLHFALGWFSTCNMHCSVLSFYQTACGISCSSRDFKYVGTTGGFLKWLELSRERLPPFGYEDSPPHHQHQSAFVALKVYTFDLCVFLLMLRIKYLYLPVLPVKLFFTTFDLLLSWAGTPHPTYLIILFRTIMFHSSTETPRLAQHAFCSSRTTDCRKLTGGLLWMEVKDAPFGNVTK